MQRSSWITGRGLRATDGSIGSIDDLLFDDAHWSVRWVVVDTGTWLPGRKVLLPPSALGVPEATTGDYPVDLTRERIKTAPGLDTDAPVSRQLESEIYGHYAWTPYWAGSYGYPASVAGAGAAVPPTGPVAPEPTPDKAVQPATEPQGDPNLRSVGEVTGYYVKATDGDIGHIEDFMIEGEDWIVRYLIIDTKNWWPGKMVLISPDWLSDVDWISGTVTAEVTRDKIKRSPEYDPSMELERSYEDELYRHYGYAPYWGGGWV